MTGEARDPKTRAAVAKLEDSVRRIRDECAQLVRLDGLTNSQMRVALDILVAIEHYADRGGLDPIPIRKSK